MKNYELEKLRSMSKPELIEEVLHARKLVFQTNKQYTDLRLHLKALKSEVYKENSWNAVQSLLNAI